MICTRTEKYIGALISSAIGDALGWPNEQNSKNTNSKLSNMKSFNTWTRRCGGKYWPHEETIYAGEYSDDTQLIIATIRSLLRGNQWSNFFRCFELPAWLSYERGGGGATKRAAQKWKLGYSPWDEKNNTPTEIRNYFMAGGNGVAMRILPHVFCNETEPEIVMSQVVLNGMYTHGHPKALVGAMVYACAISKILLQENMLAYGELIDYLIDAKSTWCKLPNVNNIHLWKEQAKKYAEYDYDIEWEKCIDETLNLLLVCRNALSQGILDIANETLKQLGCFDKKINGAGHISVIISLYMFSKYADDPYMAIYETANLKNSDTDTLSSMVGGIVGSLNGISWMPTELRGIQDFELYEFLIDQLLNKKCEFLDINKKYQLFDIKKFNTVNIGKSIECVPFGNLKLTQIRNEKTLREGIYAQTYIWKTYYGQTIFSKKIGKIIKNDPETINNQTKNIKPEKTSTYNNSFQFNKHKLELIINELNNVPDTSEFAQILGMIMDLESSNKNKIEEKDLIEEIKCKWKKYKLTKKQITAIRKILISD